MVKEILTRAGFIENVTFKECRFLKPPKTTYAVYLDSYETKGSDDKIYIVNHSYTIELYSYKADAEAEKRIESAFNDLGITYTKEPRYWLQSEELYQVIFNFDYVEKI